MSNHSLSRVSEQKGYSKSAILIVLIALLLAASATGMIWTTHESAYTRQHSVRIVCANPCVVTISPQGFNHGKAVFVLRGTTLEWTNQDGIAHRILSIGNWNLDTGIITPGSTSSPIKLTTDGTYEYSCALALMVGQITVDG